MIRQPVVAGQFYPGQKASLAQAVSKYIGSIEPRKVLGLVSPHAGYIYSGAIAGQTFAAAKIPDRVIILGPNHHGIGHPASVYATGSWETPLGVTSIDEDLARRLVAATELLSDDPLAHHSEHSLEVQLPFIQSLAPEASIVPLCIGHNSLDDLLAIGEAMAKVLKAEEDVLMVASSDMTHYEDAHTARKKDLLAIDQILALDPAELYRVVTANRISMCGIFPVVVMLAAARKMGASSATLVRYGNSGDVTGDDAEVVGYAGLTVQ